jgi:hypothetical protein
VYEGVLCNMQRHLRLTSGWRDFVRDHAIKVKDTGARRSLGGGGQGSGFRGLCCTPSCTPVPAKSVKCVEMHLWKYTCPHRRHHTHAPAPQSPVVFERRGEDRTTLHVSIERQPGGEDEGEPAAAPAAAGSSKGAGGGGSPADSGGPPPVARQRSGSKRKAAG